MRSSWLNYQHLKIELVHDNPSTKQNINSLHRLNKKLYTNTAYQKHQNHYDYKWFI